MDFEAGHFSHRWHHHLRTHTHACGHTKGQDDDLGRMGVVLAVGRIVGGLTAAVWTWYVARHLQQDWGRLATILSYSAVAAIGTDLGIPLALTKLTCRYPTLDRHAVVAAIRRRSVAGFVAAIVLIFAWVNTRDGAGRWSLAALYGISVTVTPISSSLLALLRGKAIGTIEALTNVGTNVLLPILGIAAIEGGLGVFGVLGAYVFVDAASTVAILRLAGPRLSFSRQRDPAEEEELRLRATVPLFADTMVGTAYDRVDSALLAPLAGTTAVGIYRVLSPIYGAVLLPAKAIGDTAAVGLGRAGSQSAPRATVARFALRAAAWTIPPAVLLALVGPWVLPHVLSVKASATDPHPIGWAQAAMPLRVLMLTAIPSAALAVLTPSTLMVRPQRVFRLALGALVVNVVLNLALVASWSGGLGITGATLAFLTTETMLAIALWAELPSQANTLASPSPTVTGRDYSALSGDGSRSVVVPSDTQAVHKAPSQ